MAPLSGKLPLLVGYIDPMTGAALAGSVLPWLLSALAALGAALTWPIRFLWRYGTRKYYGVTPARVVLLGLDGMAPELADKWMADGKLPQLAKLKAEGSYRRLPTTTPPESPVAWSSFLTGTDPGHHQVCDFIRADFDTYTPRLTTGEVETVGSWFIFNRLRIPLGGARLERHRRGEPFYRELARRGVTVTMLRQPLDFPPGRGPARVFASMGVTDVKGRQGDYRLICADSPPATVPVEKLLRAVFSHDQAQVKLPGPGKADGAPAEVELRLTVSSGALTIAWGRETVTLAPGEWSAPREMVFRVGPLARVPALVTFHLVSLDPFRLYVSPLNVHPVMPAIPVFAPRRFGRELHRRHHFFNTLGMAEPTDPLKDGALPPAAFLGAVKQLREDREAMLLGELARHRDGLFGMVLDLPDRVQHMFWREMEANDPNLGRVIEHSYRKLDELVGKVRDALGPDDTLVVFSDHGFTSYRRMFHLNRWLVNEGYLAGKNCERFFKGVDWSRSRAYGLGFCGLYLNRGGREKQGVVAADERRALADEIKAKLLALVDPATGERPVSAVALAEEAYTGTELAHAPDLIVGCRSGYRVSSLSAIGGIGSEVFAENRERWSGDHCIDPAAVPGVIFSTRPIPADVTLQSLGNWVSGGFFRK